MEVGFLTYNLGEIRILALTTTNSISNLVTTQSETSSEKVAALNTGSKNTSNDATKTTETPFASVNKSTNTPKATLDFLVPLLIAIGVVLLIILVFILLYMYKRRRLNNNYSKGERDVLHRGPAPDLQGLPVINAALPPLPVESVFGPERITGERIVA